jgi:hypothetical protein
MKQGWDVPFRYVFSGSLTNKMHDMLLDTKDFEPIDMLVACHETSAIKQVTQWRKEGFCRWLFCDSGAFSVHTGKKNISQEDYIQFINENNDNFDIFAQLDTIPGKYKQPKNPEDYVESANKSWENFLYMREHVKDKKKIMPVYHFGEDTKYLERMLEYVDADGDHLDYIGLSPANDASVDARMNYLDDMYKIIAKSSNPNVKTHVYGFTSLTAMSKFPCYSADSISHRLVSGYNKIYTENFGIISLSKLPRSSKTKSNLSFLESADEYNLSILRSEIEGYGMNVDFAKKYGFEGYDILDYLSECNDARVTFNVRSIQHLAYTKYQYHENNIVRNRKLF